MAWRYSFLAMGLLGLGACAEEPDDPGLGPDPIPAQEQSGGSGHTQSGDPGSPSAAPATATTDSQVTSGSSTPAASTETEFRAAPSVPDLAAGCTCSRRPEGPFSRYCPWGTGNAVTQKIGQGGGAVELSQLTRLVIPAGGLSAAKQVTLTELTTPPPAEFIDYSTVYKLEPLDLNLSQPGRISLAGSNVPGLIPSTLAVYFAESAQGPFARVDGSYANAGFYQAPITRGGFYFVGLRVVESSCTTPPEPAPVPDGGACPCSRRPEGPTDVRCAQGAGVSISSAVGSSGQRLALGGTPSTSGVPATATIPGTTLPRATSVTLTELTTPPPEGFVDASPVYKLEPLSLVLSAPGEISLPGNNRFEQGWEQLAIYYTPSVDQAFERMPDSYANAGFYQATLQRGGYFFVGAPLYLFPESCRQ